MSTYERRENGGLSIIEAVETLSHIADLEVDREIGITQKHDFIFQNQPITLKTVHWLHPENADQTISMVKDIFKVVLNYLHNFYQTDYRYVTDEKAVEEIKSLMVLVGEAAKKLDKFTHLFNRKIKESVTETKEYKDLEEFYLTHIARKIDNGLLGKWILGLAKRHILKEEKPSSERRLGQKTKHIFVDLESVKKDTEYELFFLRKEDGSRFFSPRLIRNVKLLCDFGDYFGEKVSNDLLADMRFHFDLFVHSAARNILRSFGSRLDLFYRESAEQRDNELISTLRKAFMALILCGQSAHLLRNSPTKSCVGYFKDFQMYLSHALHSREFQKLIAYPPGEFDKMGGLLLETAQFLCRSFFSSVKAIHGFMPSLKNLIIEARELANQRGKGTNNHVHTEIYNQLTKDYNALSKVFKTHTHGPLVQVLENLEEDGYHSFDPLHQGNIPTLLYTVYFDNMRCVNTRIPTPTYQEVINKASVVDEFKAFLRSYTYLDNENNQQKGHLLFNLQDKTSWKEHARSNAIEELQRHPDFSAVLTVVTLPKDTEFYHQIAPYHHDNHASAFIQHFKEHLQSSGVGFYFPSSIKNALFPEFTNNLLDAIHRLFFSNKNVLSRESRLDFIEIFELFLQIKIIEIVKPQTFSFTCKDGIDVGAAESAKLFAFMKLLSQPKLSEEDMNELDLFIHAPAILIRERQMLFDRFNRLSSTIRAIESLRDELGYENFVQMIRQVFGPLYQSSILESLILLPSNFEEI
ncbi:hypothetical protein [Parachlamydia acanthamoebae]|uniref:hypothetical protein n=1 Tax=Parachlamydia acanthamoebae TaxID=83552 RepID=UPI0007508FF7|nr:hypothetical protein [Parachlamydia acanthamoebae]